VLSEEALILAAVAGACVLLVLGVLELMWPTRPRHARHVRPEPAPAGPIVATTPPRPAQSILPRRLIDSPSASRPAGGFVFPPPADYVPPPLPREEARPPIRPIGVVKPAAPVEETPSPPPVVRAASPPAEPIAPAAAPAEPEPVVPAYIPPPAVEVEPQPSEPQPAPVEAEPPTIEPTPQPAVPTSPIPEPEVWPAELRALDQEPARFEPEPPLLEPEAPASPPPVEPPPPAVVPEPPLIVKLPPSFETVSTLREPEPPAQLPQPAEPPAPPARRRRSKISPHARPHRVLRPAPPESPNAERLAAAPAPPAPSDAPPKAPLPFQSAQAGTDAPPTRDSPLVEQCFALYQEKRFDEVLSIAEPALAGLRREAPAGPSRETAALWSVVGLAKQALGDDDGAHVALGSSIDAALDPERSTYRRHLATHALEAAQARLARAGGHDPVERMAVIRTAIAWTERGLAIVPADPALADAREATHEALWLAYEQAATTLLQRQEFTGAREILHEALDDSQLPPARAAGFRGLLSGTFGGEIGQLTAQAILSMQEGRESEALGVLRRAEEMLAAIPADTIPPTRRDEVDQRLWWGYAELGSRRLDAGDYEEALDPLVHALRFTSIGAERQAETRAAVVRALEGIAAVRALSIRRLAEAGSRDEAIVAAGELNELVKRGLELGITEDELTAAFARVRRLCEELGMDSRA
jgi:tetratricopeptide (TPR) repeat protein